MRTQAHTHTHSNTVNDAIERQRQMAAGRTWNGVEECVSMAMGKGGLCVMHTVRMNYFSHRAHTHNHMLHHFNGHWKKL